MNGVVLEPNMEYSILLHGMVNPLDPSGMNFNLVSYYDSDIYL